MHKGRIYQILALGWQTSPQVAWSGSHYPLFIFCPLSYLCNSWNWALL